MKELARASLVIARRDFAATVLSKTFLLFLLGPLFPVLIGVMFGGLTAVVSSDTARPVVAVVAGDEDFRALDQARAQLEGAFVQAPLVLLQRVEPEGDPEELRRRLLQSGDSPVRAVLEGGLKAPRLSGDVQENGTIARQLQLMIGQARQLRSGQAAAGAELQVVRTERSSGSVTAARTLTARGGQSILFVLTILLATMTLSQLIEEKSNKIIEVLASAVPVEAIFLGKLLAMLAASLIGIAVWSSAGAAAIAFFAERGLDAIPAPAVGWPGFLILTLVYFAMSYLLLGAVFLGIGAHASTAREVQMLSMPVTMAQVVVFAIASLGVGRPDGAMAIGAALFPLSSPYAMLGRAAEVEGAWLHVAAIGWQLLWVGLILAAASRLFRRNVLKSGPGRRRRPGRAAG